ncbi:sensor histidine kinase [Vibrio neptunius]|uniref:histidine kinase n=1 Tax=Vibrio neptunius TaxID=170651 RepID=A0ABS3A853_9VIBR|nr:HAMP domain-containing sensor histidine kinase [Vibrio neptunius]MBN3495571.1 HAMP domain-containing histidine kinase [Vibrio neptunius]MBN3518023.1 HAMP domain-containing histidine kinase [Vibrio neptunius]MBN3552366.1 HAMP domain-containing histidine kinase [Vibrio neptunius]MBN3580414.1 HAMP domain-containing histidine kinase [Vibrio neptunius]MCH9874081.1 HAMP domain-containing histidine kinase [Vibrio neptunius]
MSSRSKPAVANIWRSSVFRYTLTSSALFFVSALILLGIIGGTFLYNTNQLDKQEQSDTYQWLVEETTENGLDWLIEELDMDFEDLNDPEFWHERMQRNQYVVYLRAHGKDYGFTPLSESPSGWHWYTFDVSHFDEEDQLIDAVYEIRTLQHKLNSDFVLVVGASTSLDYRSILETMSEGLIWVCMTALPLSVLIAYLLSRKVYQRLDDLSDNLETISSTHHTERLPVSTNTDEFDRLSENINQMLERIEHLNTNIEDVTVGIAHDLKTPLTRLANQLQLMQMDSDGAEQHIEKAQSQVAAMLKTFNSLLRLSEIDSGKRKSHFTDINLSELIENLVDSYQPVFEDHNLQLTSAIVPAISVSGDAELLNQMMINLFENNVKYSKNNGQVWVHLQPSESGVVLQLGDNGPGIADQHRQRIFERFYTADLSRSDASNGLGLSLVQSIAHLHGASITLLPDTPGTVFNIQFSTNHTNLYG